MSRLAYTVMAMLLTAGAITRAVAQIELPKTGDLRAAAQADSNDALAHYLLALGYLRDEKWDLADSTLRTAVRLDPRLAEAYLALSYIPYMRRPTLWREERRGRVPQEWVAAVDESDRFYRLAFALNPIMDLRVLSVMFGINPKERGDYTSAEARRYDLYYQGFDDLATGRYAAAEEHLTRLASRVYSEEFKPDKVPDFVLWARGLAKAHQANFNGAIADFRRLFDRALRKEQQPEEIINVPLRTNEYRYILAVFHQGARRLDTAMALYQEAVANDLGLYMAHVQLAAIHEQLGQRAGVEAERLRAHQANPEDPTLLYDLAAMYYRSGAPTEAEKYVLQASELNPRDARNHYLLGIIAQETNRASEARAHLAQCLVLAPRRWTRIIADAQRRLGALP